MALDIPNDLIEIQDPEIDPDQIMEQIRARILQRREELGLPRETFPVFGAAAYPGEPEGQDYDEDLYYHLRKANEVYYQIGVEPSLAPSPATRLPILGRLWKQIRQEAHNLVLFYLGKMTQRQVTVNRHLVSTINRLTVQLQEQQREIESLRETIERAD
jgi:hypothetical protein